MSRSKRSADAWSHNIHDTSAGLRFRIVDTILAPHRPPAPAHAQPQRAEVQLPCDSDPVFSAEGKRIAFVRTINPLKAAVYVVGLDGSPLRQVTPWNLGVSAKLDWSPTGHGS